MSTTPQHLIGLASLLLMHCGLKPSVELLMKSGLAGPQMLKSGFSQPDVSSRRVPKGLWVASPKLFMANTAWPPNRMSPKDGCGDTSDVCRRLSGCRTMVDSRILTWFVDCSVMLLWVQNVKLSLFNNGAGVFKWLATD
jgi:hypothetical protein